MPTTPRSVLASHCEDASKPVERGNMPPHRQAKPDPFGEKDIQHRIEKGFRHRMPKRLQPRRRHQLLTILSTNSADQAPNAEDMPVAAG